MIIPKDLLEFLYVEECRRTQDIAKMFNTTSKTIVRKLHEYGIPVRQSSTINRKYTFNENYFDEINTQQKAYLLGFLCADGWVGVNKYGNCDKVGLIVQNGDIEIINHLKKSINGDNIPYIHQNECIGVCICSTHLASKLAQYGVVPNKSLTLNIKTVIERANIHDKFIPSFILGYYDGDGGIYKSVGHNKKTIQWSCGFTGTYETCIFLQKWFECGHIIDEHSLNSKTFTFRLSGKNQVYNGLSKLYHIHNTFSLTRKKLKFLELEESA